MSFQSGKSTIDLPLCIYFKVITLDLKFCNTFVIVITQLRNIQLVSL